MIIVAGTVRIDPAAREEAIAAAQEMMAATAREEGCVSYVFSADFSDPGLFHLFEEWASMEALEAHFVVPHMAVFQKKLAAAGVHDRSIHRYDADGKTPL